MPIIVPNISSLVQYLNMLFSEPGHFRPKSCVHCGALNLWYHGCYLRKADRSSPSASRLEPVRILRFFCASCARTCSVLPQCIPPRRWYLWDAQQRSFLLWLQSASYRHAAKGVGPSRHTVARWVGRFRERFYVHSDSLKTHLCELGRASGFNVFWRQCLTGVPLAQAMYWVHDAGVLIP